MTHATRAAAGLAAALLLAGCTPGAPPSATTGAVMTFDDAHARLESLGADIQTASGLVGWGPLSDIRASCADGAQRRPEISYLLALEPPVADDAAESAAVAVADALRQAGFEASMTTQDLGEFDGWEVTAVDASGVKALLSLSRNGGGLQTFGLCAELAGTSEGAP